MKKLFKVGIGLVLAGSLVACSSDEEVAVEEVETLELSENSEQEEKTEKQRENEKKMLVLLNQQIGDYFIVGFEESNNTYYLTVIDPVIINDIENHSQGLNSSFDEIKEIVENVGGSVKSNLGKGYNVNLNNPHNTEEVIIMTKDGKTFYEFK